MIYRTGYLYTGRKPIIPCIFCPMKNLPTHPHGKTNTARENRGIQPIHPPRQTATRHCRRQTSRQIQRAPTRQRTPPKSAP
ncbi:hypothetical protein BZJ20_15945, partial [Salinivibrio proteolyticus]